LTEPHVKIIAIIRWTIYCVISCNPQFCVNYKCITTIL